MNDPLQNEILKQRPIQIDELRAEKENAAIARRAQIRIALEVLEVVLPAVRDAAFSGNIRCLQAVKELQEKKLI